MNVRLVGILFAGLVAARLHPASGQVPAAVDPALAAGARVSRAVIDPYPVQFTRGDSAVVRVTLVDSVGGDVTGVSWSLRTEGTPDHPVRVRYRLVEGTGQPSTYVMSGDRPGSQVFHVAVRMLSGGRAITRDVDSVIVTVADWPVSKVVIQDLDFFPYVGTTFRLKAKVYTNHDTEADVKVLWRTDDPCHARVTPEGVVTFAQTGKINVIARAAGLSAEKGINIQTNPVATVEMSPRQAQARVGDLVRLRISASDRRGENVPKVAFTFAVGAVDSAGGEIVGDGDFIAENPGTYVLRASAGDPTAESVVEVGPRPPATPVTVAGRAAFGRPGTGALWAFTGADGRDYAYVGTTDRAGAARVYAWDVTDPEHPALTDSVTLSASAVTDIQVQGDASWAVVGREPAAGGRGGITVLDLVRPGHPSVAAEQSDGVAAGVRGVWINSPGSIVYAADATSGSMVVYDLADPRQPRFVAAVEPAPGRRVEAYDVWADAKYAFLATGADGLVVFDVGDKGTATAPRRVKAVTWANADARSVFRSGRYVYVGETVPVCDACVNGPRGSVHIVDVQKPSEAVEVARFAVPEAGAGDVWVDNGTLYAAYHQGGLRIVDVTGEMAHDVYRQGRQAGWFMASETPGGVAMVLAARPYKGHIFAVDANSGLWVLSHLRAGRLTPK